MNRRATWAPLAVLAGVTLTAALAPTSALAQERAGVEGSVEAADPNKEADASAHQGQQLIRRRPMSQADLDAKAAADRAHAAAVRSGARGEPSPLPLPGGESSPKIIAVVGTHNFAGLSGGTALTNRSPPDNEGAIGPGSYIQTINSAVRIFNRTSHAAIATGSLNQLAGVAATVNSFDPQIIWDATTNRFYYMMDSIFSSTDNKLSFGFSKGSAPTNVTTQWCHYVFNYGTKFPDYPKLGDSRFFMIAGVNVYSNNSDTGTFVGSDIVAISKPAGIGTITTCQDASTFKIARKINLKDTTAAQVFTPVASNQIDDNVTGYVVARSGGLPATKLWFYNVTRAATGFPVFGAARGVTVAQYGVPPNATQMTLTQKLDTSDARHTQAVQAINPARAGTVHSFYTQHTVVNGVGTGSVVRWYEINPAPAVPVVLRTGDLVFGDTGFAFNGAISPDRKKNGATVAFGDSFVIQHNASDGSIAPRIQAWSSLHGGVVGGNGAMVVQSFVGPYKDFTCPNPGDICRWGDYAAATPDPLPAANVDNTGVVWGTNQFSGVLNPSGSTSNWRTRIFAIKP